MPARISGLSTCPRRAARGPAHHRNGAGRRGRCGRPSRSSLSTKKSRYSNSFSKIRIVPGLRGRHEGDAHEVGRKARPDGPSSSLGFVSAEVLADRRALVAVNDEVRAVDTRETPRRSKPSSRGEVGGGDLLDA